MYEMNKKMAMDIRSATAKMVIDFLLKNLLRIPINKRIKCFCTIESLGINEPLKNSIMKYSQLRKRKC